VLGFAYGKAGKASAARMLIDSMSHRGLTGVHDFAYPIAMTYLGIGEREQARSWLAESSRHRSLWSLGFNSDPLFAELGEDRFPARSSGRPAASVMNDTSWGEAGFRSWQGLSDLDA